MTERPFGAPDLCFASGALALLSAAFLHWVRRGPGAALRGHDLIDAIARIAQRTQFGGWQVALLTIVWYLVPATGALAWLVVGFGAPHARSGRAVAALALIATSLAVGAIGFRLHWNRLGIGADAAILGTILLLLGATIPPRRSS